ncbi:MAG TPA: SUF system NifU family Fe-S cluster assembly protein [Microbacteriaceae bacterium]|nr:SUF system NifU family Fe-S cluster assembly protein [Microbacteriaceae bacterium]
MNDLEALYQELIMDHAKRRFGSGIAEAGDEAHAMSEQRNPICGDHIALQVRLNADGSVRDTTWDGAGCTISQASASMLSELAPGLHPAAASDLIDSFREVLRSRGTQELDEDRFGDAFALSGVSKYTARVKCAMLAWVAFEDALRRASADRTA